MIFKKLSFQTKKKLINFDISCQQVVYIFRFGKIINLMTHLRIAYNFITRF
jgi:hypothetical protein